MRRRAAKVQLRLPVAGPERRKTAIAARPAPEAMAKIVSFSMRVTAGIGTQLAGGDRTPPISSLNRSQIGMLVEPKIILGKPQFAEFFFNYFQVFR
jgi:hypothetical protein